MRLKEIAELLNEAIFDIEEWIGFAKEDGSADPLAIDDSKKIIRRLEEAATFIEGELL